MPNLTPAELDSISEKEARCHAGKDGDCIWSDCPQNKPGNWKKHCPLDTYDEDEDRC